MVKENNVTLSLSKGMKQTEIGLLPEDWEIESIGNLTSKIIGGGTPSRTVKEYWNGKIPWMTVKDFTSFNPNFTQENITELGLKNSATRIVSAGNLIIATRIALGKIVKYNVDVTINQDLKTINLFPKINKDYFIYSYRNIEEKIIEKGSGSTVLGLSMADLNSFQIPLPPLPEQKAIAEALSDADAWIESLEQLIAKKRLIKQGAMQELLTPQEDWEVKKLGEMGNIVIGLTYSPNDVRDFGTLVLRSSNVQNNKLAFENNVYVDMDLPERVIVKENDLLVCVRNGSKNLIGKCALIDKKTEGQAFGAFMSVVRSEFGKYLYHYFQTYHIQTQIDENLGATINQLTNATLKSFDINLPKSLTEQTRIATILSDMDAELEVLEAQLGKARKVKQGMMQELLTGRVRLV